MPPKKIDKGKAVDRSLPTIHERVPLLGEASSSARPTTLYATAPPTDAPAPTRRRRIWNRPWNWNDLLIPAIIICSTLLGICLFILLLVYSFVPSESEKSDLSSAVRWKGPTKADVVNITDDGIWLDVEGEYGVDLNRILGIRTQGFKVEEEGWRGNGARWWEDVRAKVGDRLVPMIGDLEARIPFPIEIYSTSNDINTNPDSPLVTASLPTTFIINPTTFLTTSPPSSSPSSPSNTLHPISSPLNLRPQNISSLLTLAQQAWKSGHVDVLIKVPLVEIGTGKEGWRNGSGRIGKLFGWKKDWKMEKRGLEVPMRFELSNIPSLPSPTTNLSSLISLTSYSLSTRPVSDTNATTVLGINAIARAVNIVREMRVDVPWRVGFEIGLSVEEGDEEGVGGEGITGKKGEGKGKSKGETLFKMAEVFTQPLTLDGQDLITVEIEGEIVGDLNGGRTFSHGDTPLSTFLRNYLHGRDNVVTVTGSSEITKSLDQPGQNPPKWLIEALPHISLGVPFPSPKDSPKLIRSVTIEDMRISQSGGKMVASGTVLAEIQLPSDFVGVKVEVKGVRPDVLVYDGPVPSEAPEDVPEEPPYPPKAFGRINPGYLDAESVVSDEEKDILIVRAPLDHVPLEILAGRDAVLSDFVSKVIFKGGAMAGVKGIASVEVQIDAVAGVVELENLGVNGEVKVGKPR